MKILKIICDFNGCLFFLIGILALYVAHLFTPSHPDKTFGEWIERYLK